MKTAQLDAALRYVQRGWAVFPMWEAREGRCACGKKDCTSPGKHPRTRHGFKDATTSRGAVVEWWTKWPTANVGIATGRPSGLLVLDVDPRHDGDNSLKNLFPGAVLPTTPTVHTGGGGLHLYFRLPDDLRFQSRSSGLPGVEIKADHSTVIAPPSLHRSGKPYLWASGLTPEEVSLSSIPHWLRKLLSESRSDRAAGNGHPIPEGQRHDYLVRIAGALRRQAMLPEDIESALLTINRIRCHPSLAAEEVQALARSTENWEPGAASPYQARGDGLYWMKTTTNGTYPTKLTNFDARIVADIAEDDGVEVRRRYEIEAKLHGRRTRFLVAAGHFAAMNWAAEKLGATAVVSPGLGLRDHARAAIQELSGTEVERRTIFTHCGWRRHGDEFVYLHVGGAIGAKGAISEVKVQLPESLAALKLPRPPTGERLRAAIRASMQFLRVGPRTVTFPLYAAIWRAVLGACDFSLFLAGLTGIGKTALAAVAQQHFGCGFDARHLPGSWSSTGNANEGLAFCAKDMLLVIDDFTPTGTRSDFARYHREADRILRAQGNSSGRLRLRPDGSLRSAKIPRGLILSTGEDTPRGQSLRARMLVLELSPDALDWDLVTDCQQDGDSGAFAEVLSAFLCWLAPSYAKMRQNLHGKVSVWRARAAGSAQHKRTPEIVANLQVGMNYFANFALATGALSDGEASKLKDKAWYALGSAARVQSRHQGSEDPTTRFLELAGAALATGRAHLADARNGKSSNGTGQCIGWLAHDLVLLDPDVAFARAQKLAQEQGEFLPISPKTLWKRMSERGILVQSEPGRNLVPRTIAGQRRRVVALAAATLRVTSQDRDDRYNGDDG